MCIGKDLCKLVSILSFDNIFSRPIRKLLPKKERKKKKHGKLGTNMGGHVKTQKKTKYRTAGRRSF